VSDLIFHVAAGRHAAEFALPCCAYPALRRAHISACSTFYVASCVKCAEVLGRCYTTTSSSLDHLRGCFTLDRAQEMDAYHHRIH
jgi:hypothetical protein